MSPIALSPGCEGRSVCPSIQPRLVSGAPRSQVRDQCPEALKLPERVNRLPPLNRRQSGQNPCLQPGPSRQSASTVDLTWETPLRPPRCPSIPSVTARSPSPVWGRSGPSFVPGLQRLPSLRPPQLLGRGRPGTALDLCRGYSVRCITAGA